MNRPIGYEFWQLTLVYPRRFVRWEWLWRWTKYQIIEYVADHRGSEYPVIQWKEEREFPLSDSMQAKWQRIRDVAEFWFE